MERYNKYLNQAVDFLKKTNSTIKIEYSKTDLYFPDDKCPRDIYNITISRGTRKYTFTFGNSIAKSGIPPNEYDILTGIEKYEYKSFEDFCNELGYDTDSKKAEKIYNAVKEQYLNITRLYNDWEMELLREIQ